MSAFGGKADIGTLAVTKRRPYYSFRQHDWT